MILRSWWVLDGIEPYTRKALDFILSVLGFIGQVLWRKTTLSNLCFYKIALTTVEARGAAGDHLGSHWNGMIKYGGFGSGRQWWRQCEGRSDSESIWKVESVEFADRLVVRCEREGSKMNARLARATSVTYGDGKLEGVNSLGFKPNNLFGYVEFEILTGYPSWWFRL